MKYGICVFVFSALCLVSVWSANEQKPGEWQEQEPDGVTVLRSDRNSDGKVDYLLRYDEIGLKIYEELDFNYDGAMDDFYYYHNGILTEREVDSNYDKQVDLWVFLADGVYIEKYERDTNFDGIVDVVKKFGK